VRDSSLTKSERAIFRTLRTPAKIQSFLDEEIHYNKEEDGDTCRSPRRVLRDRLAQCMEGAMFAAAALRMQGHPPLLVDLEAVRDDDHVLAVFRVGGLWGAIAKSNYSGLRSANGVPHSTGTGDVVLRALLQSGRRKTLRSHSRPINLPASTGSAG
jgi:hypothetical protein